jgi:DNA-directed RNA polymerase subunit RPC12/RpoP
MQIKITLHCPDCQSTKIKKNGKKSYGTQNYLCGKCGRQFIGDHVLKYKGCHSSGHSQNDNNTQNQIAQNGRNILKNNAADKKA